MPPSLILDLDGTLIDSAPDLLAALNRLAKTRDIAPFSREEILPMIGDGTRMLVARAFTARGADLDEADFEACLADYGANAAVETRLFPGVRETLDQFVGAGWRIAVCTNKPSKSAQSILAALQIAPLLAAVGGGDSFPTRKPDPGHLLGTLHAAGGSVDAAIMVGDHANDLQAANDAGVPFIFAAWGYGASAMATGAAAIAWSFADLPALAGQLLRPARGNDAKAALFE